MRYRVGRPYLSAKGKFRRQILICLFVCVLGFVGWAILKTSSTLYDVEVDGDVTNCLNRIVLLVTLSPEQDLEVLASTALGEVAKHAILVNDSSLRSFEETVLLSGGWRRPKTWSDPPAWIGYGFSREHVQPKDLFRFSMHLKTVLREHSNQTLILHSPFFPLTIALWLGALQGCSISVVVGRRQSIQDQTYAAFSQMSSNIISAKEYRSILLQTFLPRLNTALLKARINTKYFELSPKKSWIETTAATFVREYSDISSATVNRAYEEAILDDPEEVSKIHISQVPDGDWPQLLRVHDEAYVSIMTASRSLKLLDEKGNESLIGGVAGSDGREPDYVNGAIGLGRSLAFFDATRERILLVTRSPLHDEEALKKAAIGGCFTLQRIQPVEDQWFGKCRYRPSRAHQNVRWGLMASKLRILEMTQKAILYLDLDIVVTGRLRRLFRLVPKEYILVSEGGIQHEYLNAGFLFGRPNQATFNRLIEFFTSNEPQDVFHNLIDCTEMGLINAFFGRPDMLNEVEDKLVLSRSSPTLQTQGRTARLPLDSKTLSVGRPDKPRSERLPLAYHFIRKDLCPKPWTVSCEDIVMGRAKVCAVKSITACSSLVQLLTKCDEQAYLTWCQFTYRTP